MSKAKAFWLTLVVTFVIILVVAAATTALGGLLAPAGLEWVARGLNLGAAMWLGFFGIGRIYDGLRG
ncbi:membrane protein [Arthrobacter phage Mimi]|nr:hypothetical protein PBI_MIMI_78 [Arthrobacter phage Mimi]